MSEHPWTPACDLHLCHRCKGCGRIVHTENYSPCARCVLDGRTQGAPAMTTAQEVADTLNRFPGVTDARPVIVKLENIEYVGASYTSTSGDVRIYLLLDSTTDPAELSNTIVFLLDESEWYVGAFADHTVTRQPRYAEFHPLGPWFQLHRWTSDRDIDEGERHPRHRVPIEVVPA